MIFEIISVAVLLDSFAGLVISFTKLGDNSVEQNAFIQRYMPMTKGWTVFYAILALYIAYLTFVVM